MASSSYIRRFYLEGVRDTGRVIGDGAYAVVKELEFRGLRCAGKKLHAVLYESASREWRADMLRRFAAECELLGQLHHPHIVQFLGVRVEAGSELPELVMEYLPTTLRRCLDMHGALPAEIGDGILLEVALGLRYLHEFSPPIIHRDLSSNNILLTTSMTAKISDLGVAKILDVSPSRAARMTQTQAPGTPTFMPPEAMLARPKYTTKVDIFSFGILMVHILSGEWPMPSGVYAEDPRDPGKTIPVSEFERRRESIDKISEGHTLLGLIEQCLSNVASLRPDAAVIVHRLQEEYVRVPPRPNNQLELLQQVQSLRAELEQSSREDIVALRRENEAQREVQRREIEAQRREIEILHQNSSAQQSRYESERGTLQAQRAALQSEVEALRAEMTLMVERSQTEDESLRSQVQQLTMQSRAPPLKTKRMQPWEKENSLDLDQVKMTTRDTLANSSSPESRAAMKQWPQETLRAKEVIYVLGGVSEHETLSSVECYDPEKNRWVVDVIPQMRYKRSGLGVAVLQGLLFAIGGYLEGKNSTSIVECYNLRAKRWIPVSNMLTPRMNLGVGAIKDMRDTITGVSFNAIYLYAIGGNRGRTTLRTAEKYDIQSNSWTEIAPMKTPRRNVGVAVIDNLLYAVGGSLDDGFRSNLDSMERYCPERDEWEELPPMHRSRGSASVTALNGCLYAVGGYDSGRWLCEVECFDPSSSQWSYIAPMHHSRTGVAVTALRGEIFAIGGYNGQKTVDVVEKYDPKKRAWKEVAPLIVCRSVPGIAVAHL